jgi:hypothetical protein
MICGSESKIESLMGRRLEMATLTNVYSDGGVGQSY